MTTAAPPHAHLPARLESWLTLLVVVLLWPGYWLLQEQAGTRAQRYQATGVSQAGLPLVLPAPVLPAVCRQLEARTGGAIPPLCENYRHWWTGGTTDRAMQHITSWTLLAQQLQASAVAFAAPAQRLQAALNTLQHSQQTGETESDAPPPPEAELLQRYYSRYQLVNTDQGLLPQPLACLWAVVGQTRAGDSSEETASALSVWMAAVLAGNSRLPELTLVQQATLAGAASTAPAACRGLQTAEADGETPEPLDPLALAQDSAELLQQAQAQESEAYKASAMHLLLQQAWWQWPLWAGVGLLLLKLARRPEITPASGLGLTLMLWGGVGAVCNVYLPYTQKWGFYPLETPWLPFALPPWPFAVLVLGGLALFIQTRQQAQLWPLRQTLASRWGYAGFVLLTGLGWLMLLDQSATGHWRNRYLALNQQGYLWGAFLLLNVSAMLRVPLGVFLARWYALMMLVAERAGRFRSALLVIVLVMLAFLLLRNQRQFTSELGRLWLIAGTAWFFYLRGDPLHQVTHTQGRWGQVLWFAPMLLVGLALMLAMLITSDMGPLLISIYGAGIFIAAAVAAGQVQAGRRLSVALMLAALLVVGWVAAVTEALFMFGELNSTAAGRLESVHAPLSGMNDQLAIITWFRQATPAWGYGLGAVPWCGLGNSGSCRGVPLQIQSDYTFTALWGLWGRMAAWGVLGFAAFWHYRLIKYHPDVTSGCPALLPLGRQGALRVDPQGFLSWLGIAWVTLNLCQMAVTVSGNLGLLPLTGVTFPFISYGLVSLWVNALLLGLCIHINLPASRAAATGTAP